MRHVLIKVAVFLAPVMGFLSVATPVFAQADPATIPQLEIVFSGVVTVALTLAGLASLLVLIAGGFQFLSAGGDKEATQKAQKTISYAVGGLVLTLASWLILSSLGKFLGLDFGNFTLCLPGFKYDTATRGCIR